MVEALLIFSCFSGGSGAKSAFACGPVVRHAANVSFRSVELKASGRGIVKINLHSFADMAQKLMWP